MAYMIDKEECIGCGTCYLDEVCPLNLISEVVRFKEYKIDSDCCVCCKACVDACPVDAIVEV